MPEHEIERPTMVLPLSGQLFAAMPEHEIERPTMVLPLSG
jgi:hypothetical protein